VNEYLDVLPGELPGMPPNRDIEFLIELLPDTAPIYKKPYRMPSKQLGELKEQIQELEGKGYEGPRRRPKGGGCEREPNKILSQKPDVCPTFKMSSKKPLKESDEKRILGWQNTTKTVNERRAETVRRTLAGGIENCLMGGLWKLKL
jgi:hypothetical protein